MRLTPEEVREVNLYLTNALKKKRFDVVLNARNGSIKNVSKFNVNCLPGVCSSYVDGKQEYSYLCLSAGNAESSDLGFYSKGESSILNKYSSKNPIKIDMRTYQRVVDKFAEELNRVYMRKVKQRNKVTEGLVQKVRVKSVGGLFDGKYGILEEESDGTATVLIDFDNKGNKIRQFFETGELEYLERENLLEDEDGGEDVELEPYTIEDENIILLAEAIEDDPYNYIKSENERNVYVNVESGDSYLVLDEDTATKWAKESIWGYIEGMPGSFFSQEWYRRFLSRDFFTTIIYEREADYVDNMSEEELVMAALDFEVISKEELILDEDEDIQFSDVVDKLGEEKLKELIIDARLKDIDDSVEYFIDNYGEEELGYAIMDNENEAIEIEELLDSQIELGGRGQELATYNGREIELGKNKDGKYMYAYRTD